MSLKNKTIKKFIPAVLIVSILMPSVLFFVPKRTHAIPVIVTEDVSKASILRTIKGVITASSGVQTATTSTISSATDLKQWAKEILKIALTNLAKRFMAKMTESTINWINSGFHGSPLFLEKPESFFKDIAKYELRNLVTNIGYDPIGQPFGKNFAMGIINSFKSTFQQNAQYSLSRVTRDPALLRAVQSDFSVGGWDAFYLATQFPQNNPIGSNISYANVLSGQLQGTDEYKTAAKKVNETLAQGQGFLSPKTCPSNPAYNNLKNEFKQPSFNPASCPDPDPTGDGTGSGPFIACVEAWKAKNTCPGGLVSTTPGTVVANQIMDSLGSGKRQGELAIAMGNSLSAIFDALLNQLFQKGLNALSSKKNTPANDADDFNYFGNTLGPSTTTGENELFDWTQVREKPDNLERDIKQYTTDGSEYVKWKSPTDGEALNQIGNTPAYIPPATCPVGYKGTPPNNCVIDETYLGPPITACPTGWSGTPPDCEVDLPPPPEAEQ